ncbi:MAG: ATP-binding protein [Sphingomonadales bacterium]
MVDIPEVNSSAWLSRLRRRASGFGLGGKLAISVAIAAVVSVAATYITVTDEAFSTKRQTILPLLLVNLILLLTLGALIARRLVTLWADRRSGLAGSGLHARLVALFSIVAIAPTLVMAIFSVLFFQLGVEVWFSDRVRSVVDTSVKVAEAYTEEHRKVIRADILTMAADLNRQAPFLVGNPNRLQQVVNGQALARSLSEAVMFNSSGQVLAHANLTFSLGLDRLPMSVLVEAADGKAVMLADNSDDRVSALIRLDRYLDTYLYVSRFLDPQVLSYAEDTRSTVSAYEKLEDNLGQKQTIFNMIYIVLAVLVLLAAVWTGLWLATRLVAPITDLVRAAERIREGDLGARVPGEADNSEFGALARAFNRMTSQLQSQRHELVSANQQLDIRRRFTETVLAGVTAGVIGLDQEGTINLTNRSAVTLLGRTEDSLAGAKLAEQVPEMAALIEKARARPAQVAQGQVNIEREDRATSLLVRVATETFGKDIKGFVVTFDDITDLLAAQRTAAWGDIARRIAHEIKNPLTPIQLSAERLNRKYQKEIKSEPEIFIQCTETIVRQVGDIRRMVDEFSAFARMPAPAFETLNLSELARQALFLQEVAAPEIEMIFKAPDQAVELRCDRRQVSQALTNVLKNAVEAISARRLGSQDNGTDHDSGLVELALYHNDEQTVVEISDNGRGLPGELKDRLTEPYVTTRNKGTGLGLAIVKKVMQDHGGQLVLEDRAAGGACVRLMFHHAQLREMGI